MKYLTAPSFPNTRRDPFIITSPKTRDYNCIAWAIEENNISYWPNPLGIQAWPDDVPFEETLQAFIRFYEKFGYETCENGTFKVLYQKIAIFTENGKPTHAARQLSENEWTSKLGADVDVKHTIKSIENGQYGNVSQYMRKKLSSFQAKIRKSKLQ